MNIGNHCVLFGSRLAEDPEYVLSQYAKTGCDGVEMGARFVGFDKREQLQEILKKNGLKLAALHTNCLLTDFIDDFDGVKEYFAQAGKFLQTFPQKNLMYTPLPRPAGDLNIPVAEWDERLKDAGKFREIALRIEEIAATLKDMGVTFNFHNHNYEFENNGLIFFGILDNAPSVHMGLDIGWAYVAGFDSMELLKQYKDRVGYVHVRDYKKENLVGCKNFMDFREKSFVDLGNGDVDFTSLVPLLKEILGQDG